MPDKETPAFKDLYLDNLPMTVGDLLRDFARRLEYHDQKAKAHGEALNNLDRGLGGAHEGVQIVRKHLGI